MVGGGFNVANNDMELLNNSNFWWVLDAQP